MSQNAKKHTDGMNRRGFLKLTGAAMVAGCAPETDTSSPVQPRANKPNIYATLKQFDLRDQNGKPVSIELLKEQNRNNYATLTFSFNSCTNYCPPTDLALAELGKKTKNMVHYVVSVNPEIDNLSPDTRADFMKTFAKAGMDTDKVVILYPKKNEVANEIVSKAGFIPSPSNSGPDSHYPSIALYAPGGNYIDRQLSASALTQWKTLPQEGMAR